MYTSRLPQISAELLAAIDVGTETGAMLVTERAKNRVPVGQSPPHLRDDIHVERVDVGEYAVVAGRSATFYGHIIEHGSVHAAPHPFLVPALEESAAEVRDIVATAIRKVT